MKALFRLIVVLSLLGAASYGTIYYLEEVEAREIAKAAEKGSGGGSGSPAAAKPLPVDVVTVRGEEARWTTTAIGNLVAHEQVVISAELGRRLVGIHFQEGETVEEGRVLFTLDDADLKARLREAEAELEQIKTQRDRLSALVKQDAVSESEFDNVRFEVDRMKARLEGLRVELAKTMIRAPFAGRVGTRNVSLGAVVRVGDDLVTLYDVKELYLDFKIPERFSKYIRPGESVRFRTAGDPVWRDATVMLIQPSIETGTRSLVVRATVPNHGGDLMPGAFVDVDVPLRLEGEAFMIPSEAVVSSAQGTGLYVVDGGKAVLRPVTLGGRTAERVEVLNGLQAGQQVIVSNLLRLRPGVAVEVVPPELEATTPTPLATP